MVVVTLYTLPARRSSLALQSQLLDLPSTPLTTVSPTAVHHSSPCKVGDRSSPVLGAEICYETKFYCLGYFHIFYDTREYFRPCTGIIEIAVFA